MFSSASSTAPPKLVAKTIFADNGYICTRGVMVFHLLFVFSQKTVSSLFNVYLLPDVYVLLVCISKYLYLSIHINVVVVVIVAVLAVSSNCIFGSTCCTLNAAVYGILASRHPRVTYRKVAKQR